MANEFKVKKGLIVHGSGSTVLDIQGSQGQLFSITDDLTGTLFAVSDISGVSIFDVNADGTTTLDGNITQTSGTATFGNGITLQQVAGYSLIETNTSSLFLKASNIQIQGDLIPDADSSRNLGATNRYWENLYADNLYGDGSNLTNVAATETDTLDSVTDRGATTTNNITVGTIGSGAITSTGKIQGTELEGTSLDINGNADIAGNLTIDSGYVTLDPDTAGNVLTWKESDSNLTAGQLRSYANRGDIYLYKDGTKTTELSALTDSFIPAIHIGGTTAATGGVLQTTGNVNIDGSANISGDTAISGSFGVVEAFTAEAGGDVVVIGGLEAKSGIDARNYVDIYQDSDSAGLKIFGYDDRSAYSGNLYIDTNGNFQINQTHGAGSGYIQIQAENYLELGGGSLVYTSSNFRIYDAGQLSLGNSGDYKIKHNTAADNLIIHTDDNKGITIDNAGNVTFTEDVVVAGKVTAQEFHTDFVSASIMYESGSTKFGDSSDDNHDFTGSLNIETGDINIDSGRFLTMYGNGSTYHGIGSVDQNANSSDDIRVNSYHNVYIDLDSNNNNTDTTTFFQISQHSGASTLNTPFFKVRGDGRVGINEDNPDSILHVNTGTGTGNANTVIIDRAGSSDYSGISFATAGTIDWSIGQNAAGNFELFENGADAQTRLTVKTSGNVGIGAINPADKLHIQGGNLRLENGATSVNKLIPLGTGGNAALSIKGGNFVHNVYFDTSWNDFRYARLVSSYNTSDSSFYLYKSDASGGTSATTTISTGISTFAGNLSLLGDLNFSGGTGKKIVLGSQRVYALPAQNTKMRILTLANQTSCRVYIDSSENAYNQPIVLDIFYNSQGSAKPVIHRNNHYTWHTHSNDIRFTSDTSGHIYAEKITYSTGRNVNIRKVEEFKGTVTLLDGSTTQTGGGANEVIEGAFGRIQAHGNIDVNSGGVIKMNGTEVISAARVINATSATFAGNVTTSDNSFYISSRKFIARDANGTGLFADDASSGLSIADNGNATFTDNVSSLGTISATGKISGTELEGTSLDINGNADISGNLVIAGTVDGVDISTLSTTFAPISHNHAASEITSGTLDNARLDAKVFINDGGTFSTGFASDVDTLSGFIIKRVTGFTGTDHRAFTGHHNLLQIPNTSSNQHDAQIAFETGTIADGGIKFRNSSGGTWGSWYRLYHEGHLPTLSELGAAADTVVNQSDFVSAANGGTFSGAITSTGKISGTELEGTSLDINGAATFDTNANGLGKIDHKNSNAGSSAYTSIRIMNDVGGAEIWRNSSTRTQTGGAAQSFNIYNSQDTNIWSGGTRAVNFNTSQNATFTGNITVGSTGAAPLLFSKSTYGDMDTDAFYRIKFQDQGGVHNDVGIGQTATGNLGFNITAGKDFLFNGGTSGNALTLNAGGNATFAGNVDLGNSSNITMGVGAPGQLRVKGSGYTGAIALDASAMYIYHDSSLRDLVLGTNETARLTIDGSSGNATFAGTVTANGVALTGDQDLSSFLTASSTDLDSRYFTETEVTNLLADKTDLNHIRSLGTQAFTNGTNPSITTAQVISEIESDGGFDSYSSVFKTSWSYAGNYNLTDAGRFTETAGSSWITWTDNSSDSERGNITTLAIAPNSGGSAGKVFIYNDQGSGYAPGWREVWTSTSDGSGSGLDADKLDGQEGTHYANVQADWNATSGDAFIQNKPSTFTPSSHTHAASDITSGTLAVARGGTGLTANTTYINSNAFANFAVTTADYDTITTRGLYRFQGTLNGPFGTSHTTGLALLESSGNYGWQMASNSSVNNAEGLAYRYKDSSWGPWQTLVTKTFGDGRYVRPNTAPNAPTNLVTSIVSDTVNVTFTASTTANIDNYLVFSSVAGGDYGLISIIPPADFSGTMSIIDDSFNAGGTQAYRVYAVKNGVYSSPLTGTRSFTVGTVEPVNMSVVNLNTAYYIQYDAPASKARFITAYNIYKHEHATQASLLRSSATLIYSGVNNSYMYTISGNNNNNFHQFWVETTVA